MSNRSEIIDIPAQDEPWSLREGAWPLFCFATLIFTCLVVTSFPSRLNRWNAVSILVVPVCGAFQTGKGLSPDDKLNDIYLRFVLILASHITCLCFRDASPGSGLERKLDTKGHAWISGYKLVFNARGVGTSWEVPYLWSGQNSTTEWAKPPKTRDNEKAKRQSSKPKLASRGKWTAISVRGGYLLLNFILICCYFDFLNPKTLLGINATDYAPAKASIMRRLIQQCIGTSSTTTVTKRELMVRVHGAVANFLPDYLILSAYHDFFAIVFMAVGLDQSWEWPPLFGRISEAYSMRRFWSMFWHRLIYRSFNSHAAVVSSWLGINQKTVFSRFINNYLVFLLSGIMHGAVMWKFGTKCAWRASMQYWLLQPVAFVLEGVVQYYWGKFRRSKLSGVRPSVLSTFERIVGYTWVCAWLIWEAPKRSFVLKNCNAGQAN